MSTQVSNIIGYAWLALNICAFLLMFVAFARLFRQAWQAPNRKEQIKKVLNIRPRADKQWPNNSREADVIAIAAGIGVLLFGSLSVYVFFVH